MFRTSAICSAAALIWLGGLATPVSAENLDCSKADAPDEITICNSPALSALDSEMDGLWYAYQQTPLLMGASGARHDAAEAFLQRRRQCGADEACLTAAYRDRIGALRQRIANFMSAAGTQITGAPSPSASMALPPPVVTALADYAPQCKKLGGVLDDSTAPGIMAADLDGDGRMDYVLNPEPLDCQGAATAFCANAGCDIRLHLSRKDYTEPVSVFGGQPTLTQRDGGTDAEIWVGRTHCEGADPDTACWATYSWNENSGALTPEYQARPEPN